MGFDLAALHGGLNGKADEGLGGNQTKLLGFGGQFLDCGLPLLAARLFGFGQGLDDFQGNGKEGCNRRRSNLFEDRKVEAKDGGGDSPDFGE